MAEFKVKIIQDKHKRMRPMSTGAEMVRAAVVYIDRDRPGMADIQADFLWRRTHSAPFSNSEIKRMMEPTIQSLGFDTSKMRVSYSKYAGCKMCPCSPGYEVFVGNTEQNRNLVYDGVFDIWVE